MSSRYISDALRQVISTRAQNRCEYCKCSADVTTETFSVEHAYPRSLGGGNTLENLAWSCMGCNGFKGARIYAIDPLTNQLAPIFHPRQQLWDEHFCWSEDYCEIVGGSDSDMLLLVTRILPRVPFNQGNNTSTTQPNFIYFSNLETRSHISNSPQIKLGAMTSDRSETIAQLLLNDRSTQS
jgi:HNH endonuclease